AAAAHLRLDPERLDIADRRGVAALPVAAFLHLHEAEPGVAGANRVAGLGLAGQDCRDFPSAFARILARKEFCAHRLPGIDVRSGQARERAGPGRVGSGWWRLCRRASDPVDELVERRTGTGDGEAVEIEAADDHAVEIRPLARFRLQPEDEVAIGLGEIF